MRANFSTVIINVNTSVKNNFIVPNFFINGLFKINEKTIIDSNIEKFSNQDLKVYIVAERKYLKLLQNQLKTTNYWLIAKEEFDYQKLFVHPDSKILVIEDSHYFLDSGLAYFMNNNNLQNTSCVVTVENACETDYLPILTKDQLKYVDFFKNSLANSITSDTDIKWVVEKTPVVTKINSFNKLVNFDKSYLNDKKRMSFTPGPVFIRKEINQMLSDYVNHHRSIGTKFIYQQTAENIKWAFNSKTGFPIAMLATGSVAIESCLINLTSPGDNVLFLSNGFFGDNIIRISKRYDLNATYYQLEKGQEFNLKEIERLVIGKKSVFVVHMDTSYGIVNPIKELGEICHKHNVMLVVDCISSVLNEHLDFDDFNISAAVGTSAKGFETTPGLSFICVSQKAMEFARNNPRQKPYYLDWQTFELKHISNGLTPSTYPVTIFAAVNASCEFVKNYKSIEKAIESKKHLMDILLSELTKLGFTPFIENEQSRSNWVCVVKTPQNIKASILRMYMYVLFDTIIECGISDETDSILRIGISFAHKEVDILKLIKNISLLFEFFE
ncbi:MAG: alanine--glyoxylate aminotransferase family protein [Malacoplasma sp.]|nr:alanine--glyoxylate aminotransferase family protein [Malacoplasma sp.]